MTTILIVCGAGASSTFLASRMRSIAKDRGESVTVVAASDVELDARLDSADVLLVGAHLSDGFDALSARAAASGVPAGLLAPSAVTPAGAEAAYDLYSSLASLGHEHSATN
jgi:PTS system cellobiose-specific IIB component